MTKKEQTTTAPDPNGVSATIKRKPDPELQTMARMDRMLAALSPEAALRVVNWLNGRWVVGPHREKPPGDQSYRKGAAEVLDGDRR